MSYEDFVLLIFSIFWLFFMKIRETKKINKKTGYQVHLHTRYSMWHGPSVIVINQCYAAFMSFFWFWKLNWLWFFILDFSQIWEWRKKMFLKTEKNQITKYYYWCLRLRLRDIFFDETNEYSLCFCCLRYKLMWSSWLAIFNAVNCIHERQNLGL